MTKQEKRKLEKKAAIEARKSAKKEARQIELIKKREKQKAAKKALRQKQRKTTTEAPTTTVWTTTSVWVNDISFVEPTVEWSFDYNDLDTTMSTTTDNTVTTTTSNVSISFYSLNPLNLFNNFKFATNLFDTSEFGDSIFGSIQQRSFDISRFQFPVETSSRKSNEDFPVLLEEDTSVIFREDFSSCHHL